MRFERFDLEGVGREGGKGREKREEVGMMGKARGEMAGHPLRAHGSVGGAQTTLNGGRNERREQGDEDEEGTGWDGGRRGMDDEIGSRSR